MGWVCSARSSPLYSQLSLFGVLKFIIYVVISIVFPSFLIDTLFTSVTSCFFSSHFISLMMHKESSLLLTTPLLTFRDLWGYVLTLILWNFVIFNRKSACFLFSTSTKKVWFFNFFTLIGIKFVDITFLIMKGDKLVIGVLLDSMIMNLGKGASVSLFEESDSFKLGLNILFKKSYLLYVFHWSYAPPTTMESNLRRKWTKEKTHLLWLRWGYITGILILRAKFRTSAKFWFL